METTIRKATTSRTIVGNRFVVGGQVIPSDVASKTMVRTAHLPALLSMAHRCASSFCRLALTTCVDPTQIGTIHNQIRIPRPGGIIIMTNPLLS